MLKNVGKSPSSSMRKKWSTDPRQAVKAGAIRNKCWCNF